LPIAFLADLKFTRAEAGEGEWEQPLWPSFLTSQGVVPGGFLAVLAEAALSAAIAAGVPPRTPISTTEMSLNFFKAVTIDSGPLRAMCTSRRSRSGSRRSTTPLIPSSARSKAGSCRGGPGCTLGP
jgi:acyl-coenzyme A thioesterase PaaI-like protein